ncbi:MAG: DNA-directed RNA polymerase subunit alpha [Patescibacteria group bacterium]|nr:DNA-directed RNA polymerase subunit alpha [Patescibacteria group bacterium]MBU2508858.1 DNA-directed RNA polymerase subunit alpha [Patescibacteria group bacterium]
MESLLLPSKIRFTKGERPNEGILTFEPCEQGYGTTIGNALRRVLLSSLAGAAVTAVKIKGVDHEFSTMAYCKEDMLEIILNLKTLRMKLHSEDPVKLSLSVKGEKIVTGEDFEKNADVEIVNPDLVIAHLTDKAASMEMEITVSPGRTYQTTEERIKEKLELGNISIDALFSPVINVSYNVQATRVGEKTDYDKLVLNIETDGTIDPLDACQKAVAILLDHFSLLKDIEYEA